MAQSDQKWEGRWKQIKGGIREQFAKLTDDDIEQANGQRDHIVGRIQEKYGETKEKAEEMLENFENRFFRDKD